jgi:hypothetical protein
MKPISKSQLRFALVLVGILVVVAIVMGDFVMAVAFSAVAAFGTTWQVRQAAKAPQEPERADNEPEEDGEHPAD